MPMLDDGSVVPSFLSVAESGGASGYTLGAIDPFLRVGRVSKMHKPGDKSNQSKRFVEYDVEVDFAEGSESWSRIVYPRARVASLFGASGDYFTYTPRIVTTQSDEITEGSLVLVLCVNGDTRQAVIVGGIPHHKLAKEDPDKDQHHLKFEFNGLQFSINKDGETTIKFRGATQPDGTLDKNANTAAEGSNVTFKKDGSINIETASDNQHIYLNHDTKKLEFKSDKETYLTCNGNVNIESAGVNLGGSGATDAIVKGTTYRQAESIMNKVLSNGITTLMGLVTTAAGGLTTAAGLHVIPIAGPIAGAVPLGAAAAALTAMVPVLTAMKAGIETMEAGASSYLSTKNNTDG